MSYPLELYKPDNGAVLPKQGKDDKEKEKEFYEPIRRSLHKLFLADFIPAHFEVTAQRRFSNHLKDSIPRGRDFVLHFLKEAPPDVTGYFELNPGFKEFVVAEFKNEPLKLDDIYQVKKYGDLFEARSSLLITSFDIPSELKRLDSLIHFSSSHRPVIIVEFSRTDGFSNWFPDKPNWMRGRIRPPADVEPISLDYYSGHVVSNSGVYRLTKHVNSTECRSDLPDLQNDIPFTEGEVFPYHFSCQGQVIWKMLVPIPEKR